MFGIEASWPLTCLALLLAGLLVFLKVRHKQIHRALSRCIPHSRTVSRIAEGVVAALCIPTGFFLMEYPYNTRLFEMDATYVWSGIAICAVLFAFVYSLGQRTKTSMVVFLVACLICGAANHFLSLFKGQPVLPSDVAALQTAAEVSAGYTYLIDDSLMLPIVIIEAFLCAMALLPRVRFSRMNVTANCVAAALVAAFAVSWFTTVDIEEEYDCQVNVWSTLDSYLDQGSALCFLQRAQQLIPSEPANYSTDEALALLAGTSTIYDAIEPTQTSIAFASEALASDVQPSIVVIMNETFSDLSAYSAVSDSYAGLPNFDRICSDALMSGTAYVSALGSGTCNSEFEYLTGTTTGLLPFGAYPYMLYNLEGADSLAHWLSSLGYETSAIHPASAANWRRDRVYPQLGFDTFYDIDSFADAQIRRGFVTDGETYDKVLEILTESDQPQFIFDVTIANHGGYTTGLLDEDLIIHSDVEGVDAAEFDEYISCMNQSDIEFTEFIAQLEELDRPVVVCLFGDHQPGFADQLAEASFGTSVANMSIEQTQTRYSTPYVIWTNDETLRFVNGTGATKDLSLNYLGANTLKAAGLPLDDYFSFVMALEEVLPAINLNGYQDAEGTWYWHSDESLVTAICEELAIVQHNKLFGSS